jgi:hypothetical protein
LYNYNDDAGKIVGGDAYNFIIIGVRGLGFIASALFFGMIASVLLVISRFEQAKSK